MSFSDLLTMCIVGEGSFGDLQFIAKLVIVENAVPEEGNDDAKEAASIGNDIIDFADPALIEDLNIAHIDKDLAINFPVVILLFPL